MANFPQFILWKLIPTPGKPKPDKVPVNVDGRPIDPHFAGNQMAAADALALAAATGYSLGFVFTERDPFFFLDVDDAKLPDGSWFPRALDMCQRFQGAAVEISQSGTGLHIFGCGKAPAHSKKNKKEHLELYTELRFVALTGVGAIGDIWTDHTATLHAVCSEFFPPNTAPQNTEWTDGPCEGWDGYTDDQQLIAAAMRSKSASNIFGAKASFAELWEGDPDTLGKYFPDGGGRAFDESAADLALCSHLAFWTGKDCARIERLVSASGLMREKWAGRPPYRQSTILRVVAGCKDVYAKPKQSVWEEPKPPAPPQVSPNPAGGGVSPQNTSYYMQPHEQLEHFKGCVYVRGMHRVFTPDGALLQPQQFKSAYGGRYFITDPIGNKGVKNAFEAFTENGAYRPPTAHTICFRPDLPPASIITEEGATRLNIYVPIETPCAPGDITLFEQHLAAMLPDPRDRTILLSYMAAAAQYPGAKFQWAPLIQGVEGNGKSALGHILKHTVGTRYYHVPNAQDITNKFNGWLVGKLVIAIEEIKIADKWEALETLKPLITNSDIEIQGKGQDQVLGDNRANFLLFTNHQDALRVSKDNRRYCMFYTAQQTAADIQKHGLGGDFFPRYYRWLRDGGYAALTYFLKNYQIPAEFNPAEGCHRAPVTTSTTQAIRMSMSPVEQEIQAAIDEERAGFRGGWISSIKLDALLGQLRYKVARNTRRTILEGMGYFPHPALAEGKACRMIFHEAGRPVLYARPDGPHWGIADSTVATAAYEATLEGEWGK